MKEQKQVKTIYVSEATGVLARNRKRKHTLEILVALLACFCFVALGYAIWALVTPLRVVIYEPSTEEMMMGTVVDATGSKEICDELILQAMQAMYNRNPAGLDEAFMVDRLFEMTPACGKRFLDSVRETQPEYAAKKLTSKIEVFHMEHQPLWGGDVQSTVQCQQKIQPTDQVKQMTVVFTSHRNPNMEHRKRFPLMIYKYDVTEHEPQLADK